MCSQTEVQFKSAQYLKLLETPYDSFRDDWIHPDNTVEVNFLKLNTFYKN